MQEINTMNIDIRFSESMNYAWAIFHQPVSTDDFIDCLSDEDFTAQLKENNTKNLLLDCSRIGGFSVPGMSDYIDTHFAKQMAANEIEKISVVIDDDTFYMLQFIFTELEEKHAANQPQILFFNTSQFYDGFEAVNWF